MIFLVVLRIFCGCRICRFIFGVGRCVLSDGIPLSQSMSSKLFGILMFALFQRVHRCCKIGGKGLKCAGVQ